MSPDNASGHSGAELAIAGAACLLCGEPAARITQRMSAASLIEAYREALGIVPTLSADEIRYLTCQHCGLQFFDPPVTGDEQFYAALQKIPWYYSAGKEEFGIAAEHVRASDHVLEIGAGRGLFSREIQAASYTGLEFSTAAVELAAANGIRLMAETIEHHARANPGRYDVVCAFQVLEHVAAPRSFLDAAIDAMKSGARLIVSVPAEDSFARFAFWDVLNMPPHHVTRWTDDCLRSIAAICELRLIALIPDSLRKNMRRLYAQSVTDIWLAERMRFRPSLLDERLKTPLFLALAAVASRGVRRYLSLSQRPRRGHAVVAVFEKNRA
jgi:2-polyprenyl-3-methyl-5-hydroxy-6-metoxy-1,4-benzoquinol methylase